MLKINKNSKGMSRIYKIWISMRYRCNTATCKSYKNYGGRGIKVCDEWNDFNKFLEWSIENGYEENLTIDRIDNDKWYEPSNCQWITKSENTAKANKGKQKRKADKGLYYGLSPNNEYYEFINANEFARKHYLNAGCIRATANHIEGRTIHKGWRFGFVSEKSL